MLVAGQFAANKLAAADSLTQPEPRWIGIGSEKAVIARDSKSADGRNALAWTVDSSEPVDWSLLERNPNGFYEQYDVKAIWVINLTDKKKVGALGDTGGYVRPGSHRTLSVAWGPIENGRRFGLAAYQWKWGTDTLLLLDVGTDDCRFAQIGPVLDKAIEAQIKRAKSRKRGPFDSTYLLTGLPELGKKLVSHLSPRIASKTLRSAKAFSLLSSRAPAKVPLPASSNLLPDRCRTIPSPSQRDSRKLIAN